MSASPRLTRWFRALCLLSCAGGALQACGGRSDTSDYLFDGQPSAGGSSSASAGTANSGAVSSGAVASGGSRPTPGTGGSSSIAGTSAGGSASMQGGAPGTGGGSSGGAPSGGVGMAGTAAVGGQAGNAPITCGASVCNGFTQTCCATLGGVGCIPKGQACGGAVLDCGASSDCDGNQVCCLTIVGEVGSNSQCKNSCMGMGPGRERQLCSSDADCQNQRRCRDTVFGVSVCTRL